MGRAKLLYKFVVDNTLSKGNQFVVYERNFKDAEKWVRGEFRRHPSINHIDVHRLRADGSPGNLSRRYFRSMRHKAF